MRDVAPTRFGKGVGFCPPPVLSRRYDMHGLFLITSFKNAEICGRGFSGVCASAMSDPLKLHSKPRWLQEAPKSRSRALAKREQFWREPSEVDALNHGRAQQLATEVRPNISFPGAAANFPGRGRKFPGRGRKSSGAHPHIFKGAAAKFEKTLPKYAFKNRGRKKPTILKGILL